MGADLIATTLALPADNALDKARAREVMRNLVLAETSGEILNVAAEYVDALVLDPLAIEVAFADPKVLSSWQAEILAGYETFLSAFEEGLESGRDVTSACYGGVRVYFTGGMSWGDYYPTESYNLWVNLLEDNGDPEYGNPYHSELQEAYGFLLYEG